MNKHWSQHTQQQAIGSHGLRPKHTDHRQNQTHPGEGHTDNTSPPERQHMHTQQLTKRSTHSFGSGQTTGTAHVGAVTGQTPSVQCVHTQERKCAHLPQSVHTSEGGPGGRQLPAPHPLKGSGSDLKDALGSPPMPGPLHFRAEGTRPSPTAQGGRLCTSPADPRPQEARIL